MNPGAAPAAVPTVLMTHDPSRPTASMRVITRPAKLATVATGPTPPASAAFNKGPAAAGAGAAAVGSGKASPFGANSAVGAPGNTSPFGANSAVGGPAKPSAFAANPATAAPGKPSPFGASTAVTASSKGSAFGTSPATAAPGKAAAFAASTPGQAPAAAPAETRSTIQIKGLTGTLNKGDIHQTMEARQGDFDACIEASRRRLRWVSGSIHFGFRVDGQGRIINVHPTTSDIGHNDLEQCLTAAVATTQFPKPAGRATAEFGWGLSVESAMGKPVEAESPKIMASLVRKQAKDVFKNCEVRRRRARFRITAYLAPSGRILSAGAVAQPAQAQDKVDCVLDELAKWHTPKVKRSSKVSFELR